MVSVRLTVVPQMARISSGSSDGPALAERLGAEEDGMASELRLLGPVGVRCVERRLGVKAKEEWMSPRRLTGVLLVGLLKEQ